MTEWFRSWHGAPTDNKWLLIGRRTNIAPGIVSAIWWALLDHASQAVDRGRIDDFDVETYAAFSGFDDGQIRKVLEAFTEKGLVVDGAIVAWEKRQPEREDPSAASRQRKRRHALSRTVTQHHAPDTEQNREEERRTSPLPPPNVTQGHAEPKPAVTEPSPDFEAFWEAFPIKKSRDEAEKAYSKALSRASPSVLLAAAERYAAEVKKPGAAYPVYPQNWLGQARWLDATGPPNGLAKLAPERAAAVADKADKLLKRGKYAEH